MSGVTIGGRCDPAAGLRGPVLPKRVRTIRAIVDDAEHHQRRIDRRRRHPTLPPPAPAAIATAISVLEVRAGLRAPHQLERLSHYSLWPAWPGLAEPAGGQAVPIAPRPRAVTVQELAPGLVDATVVIVFGGSAHALALRLDGAPGYWQLVELDYPTERTIPDLPAAGEAVPALAPLEDHASSPHRQRARRRQLPTDTLRRTLQPDLVPERQLRDSAGIELD